MEAQGLAFCSTKAAHSVLCQDNDYLHVVALALTILGHVTTLAEGEVDLFEAEINRTRWVVDVLELEA